MSGTTTRRLAENAVMILSAYVVMDRGDVLVVEERTVAGLTRGSEVNTREW